jgi:hypothetical protein
MSEYVMVPRELTLEMLEAFEAVHSDYSIGDAAWAAMLAAAPTPPDGEPLPDGYHYVYQAQDGSGDEVIVHNNGSEWNGQKPLRALPYYYTAPQPTTAESLDDLMRRVAERYPIAAIVHAIDKAAPGFEGLMPKIAASAPREPVPDNARALLAKAYCCDEAGRKSVDLEQFRGPLELAKLASQLHLNESSDWAISECDRLLAIIDGKKS